MRDFSQIKFVIEDLQATGIKKRRELDIEEARRYLFENFELENTVEDDLRFPATRVRRGANNLPDFDYTNLGLLMPQNDATEIIYVIAQFSHSRKAGSNIFPHIHFIQDEVATPVFKMEYKWYQNHSEVPALYTPLTATTFTKTFVAGTDTAILNMAIFPTIDGSAIVGESSMMDIKIWRDDNVVTGDVLLKEFDIHYIIDALGSYEEY